MREIFMATGHNKIIRYMILYVLKLFNIDLTYPDTWFLLVNGALYKMHNQTIHYICSGPNFRV